MKQFSTLSERDRMGEIVDEIKIKTGMKTDEINDIREVLKKLPQSIIS